MPAKRDSMTIRVPHHINPATTSFLVTMGHYPDGAIGEIFINTEMRAGSDSDTNAADFAIVVSLALQHGCSLGTIVDAMKHNRDGSPTGVFAHILDAVRREVER